MILLRPDVSRLIIDPERPQSAFMTLTVQALSLVQHVLPVSVLIGFDVKYMFTIRCQ